MSMNFKKEGQKLPLFGIGPLLVWGIGLLTLVGIILTIILINTEEKWLLDVYGEPYAQYKNNVNRLIPWKRRGNGGV